MGNRWRQIRERFAIAVVGCFFISSGVRASVVVQPADTSPLSLEQTVEAAIANAPDLKIAAAEKEISSADKRKALGAFLPQVDLTANQGFLSGGSQRAGSSLSLQLTENLFDSGISLLNFDSASLRNQAAEQAYLNARDLLSLSIAQQFIKFSLQHHLLEVQEAQYDIIKKQHQNIESLYRQGVKTRKDYLRFTTEMRRNEIEVLNAKIAIQNATIEMNRLIGTVQDRPTLTFKPLALEYSSAETIPAKAPDISQHFQFRIAGFQKEVFGNDVSVAQRRFWPMLSLSASASYLDDDYLRMGRGFSGYSGSQWSALATIQWNLMDWGIRRKDIAIANQRKMIGEQQIRERLNTFTADNEKLMQNLNRAHTSFKLSKELMELETKTYEVLRAEYQNGKVTYLDLIVGLRDLLSAKVRLFSTYFELQALLYQYRYHEGRLYESLQKT